MSKWIRIMGMLAAIIAVVVLNLIPGANESMEWISLITAFILAAWNAWKNNDFTFAAKVGSEVMNAIKDGKVPADEVKAFLDIKESCIRDSDE